MLALISPAKTLDFSKVDYANCTIPNLLDKSSELVKVLQVKSQVEIKNLMSLSDKLAELNYQRYQNFNPNFVLNDNAKQAIFAFKGDVYTGIDIKSFTGKQIEFLNDHLLILSGLYGTLKPFDLIMPYRLEMGTKLSVDKKKNLYEFWGNLISQEINKLEQNEVVNLASNEYFKAVNTKTLNARLITINFKEYRDGKYKTIGIFAKKARGKMVNFMAKNNISKAENLKNFNLNGYAFNQELSNQNTWVFSR
jgi:cytoplasmic iron level regulating protein YaaA (DUF328/UPF0246 family)